MPQRLQTFKGYTVDTKLRQFRKVSASLKLCFINFDSPEGDNLLVEYVEKLDTKKGNDREALAQILNSF